MKKIKKLTIVLLIVFVSFGIFSIAFNVCSNIGLKKSFNQRENAYPYRQVATENNIDLLEIKWIFPNATAPMGNNYIQEITAPVSISYYNRIDDPNPAYTIEKGTVIRFDSEEIVGYEFSVYRGTDSLPTHEQGWRLAKPFIVEGESTLSDDLLYVKLSDLKEIAETWVEANPKTMVSQTKHERVKNNTLRRDQSLYQEGVYLSPDLEKPVLSNFTYTMFTLAFVAGMLHLCLRKFGTKK